MKAKKKVSLYKKQSITGVPVAGNTADICNEFLSDASGIYSVLPDRYRKQLKVGRLKQLCKIVERRRIPYSNHQQFLLSDHSGSGYADPCDLSRNTS